MVKKLQALKAKKGFTLVELIVVIAIIGVLAAILIPTLSGVIESSRKRSAESTCQSIQNMAKTYASTMMSKKGLTADGSDDQKVDMDEEGVGETSMKDYIQRQIPELTSEGHHVTIELTAGNVTGVKYQEGAFISTWTAEDGLCATQKGDAAEGTGVTIGDVEAPAAD